MRHPNNPDKSPYRPNYNPDQIEYQEDESKLLLKKVELLTENNNAKFYDPAKLSSAKTSELTCCYECCGSIMMYGCFPCNILCCCGCFTQTVEQGEAGIMSSFGKYEKTLEPGFYFFNSCLYDIKKISVKLESIPISIGSLQTRDGLTIMIAGFVTYKCVNPYIMVYSVANINSMIQDIASGLLKRLVSENDFRTILIRKRELAKDLTNKLDISLERGGVKIPFVDITRIEMSGAMQQNMSQAAITKKQAESSRITAEAEVQSSQLLKKAGDIMNQNKASIHLKYFETLRDIASNWNHTVILPDGMVYVPK